MAIQALLIILAVMAILLVVGVPISYAIGISALAAIVQVMPMGVSVLTAAQRTFVGMSKFSLTAIPFFILAGNLMNQGGIAKRLVDFVLAILGKLPGSLMVTNIGANALFGAISGSASVAALFMAGYVPGIIWALCCGVFTATEGSAIAVVYALILGICYRNITLKSFWNIVVDSAKMSGMIVFLIGVSNILGWVMAFTQIPQAISSALLGLTDNFYVILLIMNAILLIAGTFMDVTPAILIFTPLFLPIVKTFGMNPVQFGLILVYNLCIGNITPPIGNTLFVAIKVGKTTLAKVLPYMLMYYIAILIGLMLVTYVPFVSLGLPTMAGLI